jgi:MFS family permease
METAMAITPLASNRSFIGLTTAQFLGTINDHLFKTVVSLFAIGTAAEAAGAGSLSLSSILFVIPYLLFSGYAGEVADRLPKRTLLRGGSFADIVIMAAGLLALTRSEHVGGMLVVLTLMATQATFFSPSKYGCVPAMVAPSQLTRASGVLEASRYAAVILGTVAGGVLMELWREAPALIGAVTVSVAVVEFLCSLMIEQLPSVAVERNCASWPWSGVAAGIAQLGKSRSLAVAVASITFFEAVAALVLMDVLLVAKTNLGVGDAQAGALGGFAAIGAGLGALFCSILSRPKAELGFTPVAGLGLGLSLVALSTASTSYAALACMLAALGACGGAFFLPFLAWLQKSASDGERGLVLSTNNFMNMLGVLTAASSLWLLSAAGLSPRAILAVSAVATFVYVATILIVSRELRAHLLRRLPLLSGLFRGRDAGRVFVPHMSRFNVPRAAAAFVAIATLAMAASAASPASAADQTRHMTYEIRHARLGHIGSLTQDITVAGDRTDVATRINVHASLFGVTLRRMQSEWHEQWQGERLRRFEGTTEADGTTSALSGEAGEEGFIIRKGDEIITAPIDVQPVNPWSLQFTRATTFMSPETARLSNAEIIDEGPETVKIDGRKADLRRYRATFEGEHELFFDDTGTLIRFAYSEFAGKVVVTLKNQETRLAAAP